MNTIQSIDVFNSV